jgi:CheY-like chemotaxis protein
MPGINRPKLVQGLRHLLAGIKIAYLSGYAPEYLIAEGVTFDAVVHLAKPFIATAL